MPNAQYKSTIPLTSSKVDRELGIIRDVALMSVGTAHGSIDGKPMTTEVTLDSLKALYELLAGAPKKSHMLHGDDHAPTNAIGLFSGFYIDMQSDPVTLRAAQFEAFKAFRENSKKEFETMFELADKSPKDMAMSADFDLELGKRDGLPPVVMPISVRSFDFVNEGAATPGLFEKNIIDEAAIKEQQRIKEIETQSQLNAKPTIFPMKAIYAKFSDNTKALKRACQLAAETPDMKEEDVIDKVDCEMADEAAAALVAERDALKAKVIELETKLAELNPKAEEAAELSKKVTDLEAKVAQFTKTRGRFGAHPVNLGVEQKEEKKLTATFAEFAAMDHTKKSEFSVNGGRIVD
jgi:hypothetical protein